MKGRYISEMQMRYGSAYDIGTFKENDTAHSFLQWCARTSTKNRIVKIIKEDSIVYKKMNLLGIEDGPYELKDLIDMGLLKESDCNKKTKVNIKLDYERYSWVVYGNLGRLEELEIYKEEDCPRQQNHNQIIGNFKTEREAIKFINDQYYYRWKEQRDAV